MTGRVGKLPSYTLTGTSPISGWRDTRILRVFSEPIIQLNFNAGLAVDSTSSTRIISTDNAPGLIAWYSKWKARLDKFLDSPACATDSEWPAPTPVAVSRAAEFLENLHEFDVPPSNISQSAIGGIAFSFIRGDIEVFVEFLNSGRAFAAVSELADTDDDFQTYEIGNADFGYGQLIEIISTAGNA